MTRHGHKASKLFILVVVFLDLLGLGIVIPILPELVATFQHGDRMDAASHYGWIVGVYSAMQFLFAPLLGVLSDRFGRRPVLLISLAGVALDYVLTALSPTVTWIFIARLLGGVFTSNVAVAFAYMADISAPEDKARNFGLIGAAWGFAFVLGPVVGGSLGTIDLRLPFLVAGGLTTVNWLYGVFVLPESLPVERRGRFAWGRAHPGAVLSYAWANRRIAGLVASVFLIRMAQFGVQAVWVLYTGFRYGWGTVQNGIALALMGVIAIVVQGGLVGPLTARFGERRLLLIGLLVMSAGFFAYGLAGAGWAVYAIMVAAAPGELTTPSSQALLSRRVPDDEQGTLQGLLGSLASLAGMLAPPLMTTLFTAGTARGVVGLAFFATCALGLASFVTAEQGSRPR